jgi:hypothetical protein
MRCNEIFHKLKGCCFIKIRGYCLKALFSKFYSKPLPHKLSHRNNTKHDSKSKWQCWTGTATGKNPEFDKRVRQYRRAECKVHRCTLLFEGFIIGWISWDTKRCSLLSHLTFWETCHFHLQDWSVSQVGNQCEPGSKQALLHVVISQQTYS